MPRLLRIHFSSIGHSHARLAPLTLDFRQERGTGTDSVLWLRNAGGKSSILNLFFSIFRPDRREFLGTNAEGKARRLEDYVKGTDLACVATEWDVDPASSGDLFASQPRNTRVVGQLLAWRGQQRSADVSKLRRLFFSFRTDPGRQATFDALPIIGLAASGPPAESFDGFRNWLQELHKALPELEVVQEESHKRWVEHLERLGLDPELFRYQIKMNLREGAADELFRFDRAVEFVRFLLELALDVTRADQVATNLGQLRERLTHRPALLLEEQFLRAVLAELEPLVGEVAQHRAAAERLRACRQEAAAFSAGLLQSAALLEQRAEAEVAAAQVAAEAEQRAANSQRSCDRWAAGLTKRAHRLEHEEARSRLDQALERRLQAEGLLRSLRAAERLDVVRRLEAELGSLREALQRSEVEREPLIRRLQQAGSQLRELLEQTVRGLKQAQRELEAELTAANSSLEVLRKREGELQRAVGVAAERVGGLRDRLARRDQARERLRQQGVLQPREETGEASVRWEQAAECAAGALETLEHELEQAGEALTTLEERCRETEALHARQATEVRHLQQQHDRACARLERLATHPRLLDVLELERADVWANGLEARVRSRAEALHRHLLQLKLDAAEDERALEAVEQTGLLPPSRDTETVVERLRGHGIPAFSGLQYLAGNASEDEAGRLLLSDPARFTGVVVPRPDLLERAAALAPQLERLRGPLQVSVASLEPGPCAGDWRRAASGEGGGVTSGDGTESGEPASGEAQQLLPTRPATASFVLPPGHKGLYSPTAAQQRRLELMELLATRRREEDARRSEERELGELAADLARFLEEYPQERFLALGEQLDAARALQKAAAAELQRLAEERVALQRRREELRSGTTRRRRELEAARQALTRLQEFVAAHEKDLPRLREELDAERQRQQDLTLELARLTDEGAQQRERRRELEARLAELRRQRQAREGERDAIHHAAAAVVPVGELSLEQAEANYRQLLAAYQHELSENRLQWEVEQQERRLVEAQRNLRAAAEGLEPEAVEQTLRDAQAPGGPTLAGALREAEAALARCIEEVGRAGQEVKTAEARLSEPLIRRAVEDLPPLDEPPRSSAEAHALAERYRADTERARAEKEQAAALRVSHESNARALQDSAAIRRLHRERLIAQIKGMPEDVTPGTVPAEDDRLVERVRLLAGRYEALAGQEEELHRQALQRAEQVRGLALDERFAEHRSQVRERLKAEPGELMERAADHAPRLRDRLEIICRDLEEIDNHRRLLVGALDGVASEAIRLLRRVGPASVLPASLPGWGGRSYLEIRFEVPSVQAERHARLEPLVDRLVQEAHLPGGLTLAQRAVEELAGVRGFEVSVLKPDTVLRPERLPVTTLSTFSRGQQLTAAILLYCTLVRLRALGRGRSYASADAGVLLLDNPIGTCSSVPLLELQRSVAREMRVQLVYTTGVHDLEALATLPNVIRLRNSHRDRLSGDQHVTLDAPEEQGGPTSAGPGGAVHELHESAVSGVRVVEAERR